MQALATVIAGRGNNQHIVGGAFADDARQQRVGLARGIELPPLILITWAPFSSACPMPRAKSA